MAPAFQPLVKAGNQAVAINRPHGLDYHITKRGSDWLWAATALFGLVACIYVLLFFVAEIKNTSGLARYSLAAPFLIAFFEFFAYFTYASNLGWTGTQAEFHHVTVSRPVTNESPGVRQVFYAKYIAWFLSWPLLLFLQELAAASTSTSIQLESVSVLNMIHSLLVQIVGTFFWVIALLVGALIPSTYRWGYWTIGTFIMLVTQGIILQRQFQALHARGFAVCVLLFVNLIVWLYFICWGLSEGGNRIQPDSEAIFYGILDLCVFAIYPSFLVFLIGQFGNWPNFSFRGAAKSYNEGPVATSGTTAAANPEITAHRASTSDEVHYEKTEGPNSIRDSGETQVPRSSAAHNRGSETESESESV
ncbi:BN860_13718g1_1 [Zygosaccharomyces bailii CLIB 213]|uniref:BN860_13718g1_1 n=1 Tax=Zygosaccharomyces bailii (strain CLIB 213 / ATCC 58445 / CBS 680 / BCRC 21525 / NBRC 1098 / NCYC 1416 / NRRL Y-2227) TaxID=1333698 RepID=A0A8J2T5U5_ZYGB2|nr:BN860_13718g1_1 [Zygosaccharomyces bailii CLIB 213]